MLVKKGLKSTVFLPDDISPVVILQKQFQWQKWDGELSKLICVNFRILILPFKKKW